MSTPTTIGVRPPSSPSKLIEARESTVGGQPAVRSVVAVAEVDQLPAALGPAGALKVELAEGTTVPVSGSVAAACSGTVAVSAVGGTVAVSGAVAATCSGTVDVASVGGTVTVSGTVAATGPLTDEQLRAEALIVLPRIGTAGASVKVAALTSAVQLLAANPSRIRARLHASLGSALLRVGYSATVGADDYAEILLGGETIDVLGGGAVWGIWTEATGSVRVTEEVA